MTSDGYYRTRFRELPGRRETWQAVTAYLERFLPPDARILELGAGYCHFINEVRGSLRTAVDRDPGLPDRAGPGVETVVGPVPAVLEGFANGSYQVVFASNFLEHLDWPAIDKTVSEIRRILAPGGRLILVQPNFKYSFRAYFDDYTHRTVFTEASIADYLSSAGFRPEKVVARFLPLSFRSYLPRTRWLVALYLRCPVRPAAGQMLVVARKEPDVA